MVGSSKILTVSYGTFSCTLEGFDDSFDTMKAIAEYFRDLAADDRYFGAEPPTPDAEMLARIAEREISRRVEASEQQGRIVLRADEAPRESEDAIEDDGPPEEETPRTALAAPKPEPEPEAKQEQDVPEPSPGPEPETAYEEPSAETVPTAPQDMSTEDVAPESAATAPEVGQYEHETGQSELHVPLTADPDSFAAKLHLIRSVVSRDAPSAGDQYSEDEHAQDFVHSGTDDAALWPEDYVEDDVEDLNAAPTEPVAQIETEAPEEDTFEDTLAALMADAGREPETGAEARQGDTAQDDGALDDDPVIPHAMEAGDEADDAVAEAAAVAEEDAVAPDETSLEDGAANREETVIENAPSSDARAEQDISESLPEDDLPEDHSPTARVVKVKRVELEETIEQGLFEEEAADTQDAEDDATENMFGEDAALSPEEEAELQRELAELEAEFKPAEAEQDSLEPAEAAQDSPETVAPAVTREAEPTQPVAQPADDTPQGRRKLAHAEAENDLSRIFDETDNQLEAPASSQRRNTIQHLRAALEATRAEKQAGSELKPDVDDTPYRSDLADVVRPRRPKALSSEARSARPVIESRPAPLKLVAEQRVDTERAPIRPRRVSSTDIQTETETAQDGGFTAFAENAGATALPDLLEAAAAYLADVEGRPQFSRPMLMGKLKEIEQDRFSREDGLRSFGRLLREGKLQKLSGGRFAITEETEFRAPDKRQAG